jgi:hypothetical protein
VVFPTVASRGFFESDVSYDVFVILLLTLEKAADRGRQYLFRGGMTAFSSIMVRPSRCSPLAGSCLGEAASIGFFECARLLNKMIIHTLPTIDYEPCSFRTHHITLQLPYDSLIHIAFRLKNIDLLLKLRNLVILRL